MSSQPLSLKSAVEEFNTSSIYKLPQGWSGEVFRIKNDYPQSSYDPPHEDKPWLKVDFKTEPEKYCDILKDYFFKGNTENNFDVHKNKVRSWYHPPWLHVEPWGREPIHGLIPGGMRPPYYIAKEQRNWVQGWFGNFFNWEAATILGDMWQDPENPKWEDHLRFPIGSVVCDIIFADIGDEVPFAKGSPEFLVSIGKLPKCPEREPPERKDLEGVLTPLRLIQADFIVRDDRSPIGWVFGSYTCDGRRSCDNPWDKVFSIGLQWGNDPDLLQKQYDEGKRPTQLWINPVAKDFVKELGGFRPWLGWHDRLDGLISDFMSTCTSCHLTAQLSPPGRKPTPMVQDPQPRRKADGTYVQDYEEVERLWLRNLPHGTPFDEDSLSADYIRACEFSFRNYLAWKTKQPQEPTRRFCH